jgi:hypothetical protein
VWLDANGKQCGVLCRESQLLPVTSGRHPNGAAYYVCALDAGDDGYRVGYQLSTSRGECVVGYDGREVASKYRKQDKAGDSHDEDKQSKHDGTRCLCYEGAHAP